MSTLLATKSFRANISYEFSYTPQVIQVGEMNNKMDLYRYDERRLGISWEVYSDDDEMLDDVGIGIWLDESGKNVTDYDGVFSLPDEAIYLLRENGFNTGDVEI